MASIDKKEAAITILRSATEKWPSPIVARSSIKIFTGGLYSAGFLANCDSQSIGPEGAFRVGRQIVYPVASLVNWLISRLEV
jgi:hypothetical protein